MPPRRRIVARIAPSGRGHGIYKVTCLACEYLVATDSFEQAQRLAWQHNTDHDRAARAAWRADRARGVEGGGC